MAKLIVLVVWEGIRPDFVSLERTTKLWQLRTNGVCFANRHSTYPSSTKGQQRPLDGFFLLWHFAGWQYRVDGYIASTIRADEGTRHRATP